MYDKSIWGLAVALMFTLLPFTTHAAVTASDLCNNKLTSPNQIHLCVEYHDVNPESTTTAYTLQDYQLISTINANLLTPYDLLTINQPLLSMPTFYNFITYINGVTGNTQVLAVLPLIKLIEECEGNTWTWNIEKTDTIDPVTNTYTYIARKYSNESCQTNSPYSKLEVTIKAALCPDVEASLVPLQPPICFNSSAYYFHDSTVIRLFVSQTYDTDETHRGSINVYPFKIRLFDNVIKDIASGETAYHDRTSQP